MRGITILASSPPMVKFPYTILPSKDLVRIYKPLVPVRIGNIKTHKITSSPVTALIDSGADVCFCSSDIGVWLGINMKKKQSLSFTAADNKTFFAYKEIVNLYVCNKIYHCPFYFCDTLPKQTPIILGQRGFFDKFKIIFDLPNTAIKIG